MNLILIRNTRVEFDYVVCEGQCFEEFRLLEIIVHGIYDIVHDIVLKMFSATM